MKTHARKSARVKAALCGTRAASRDILLGGAFKGLVTCKRCIAIHNKIVTGRRDVKDKSDAKLTAEFAIFDAIVAATPERNAFILAPKILDALLSPRMVWAIRELSSQERQ